MCLENIKNGLQVASEDIIVYKVLDCPKWGSSIYYAPFQRHFSYPLGEIQTCELRRLHYGVEDGFHSYVNYHDAWALASKRNEYNHYRTDDGAYVMKAIIPKGSEYYLGDFNGDESYASNKLLVVRRMALVDTLPLDLKYLWRYIKFKVLGTA